MIDLSTALGWTVDWTKSFQAKADMRNVTETQIAQFMRLAERRSVDEVGIGPSRAQNLVGQTESPLQEHEYLFDLLSDSVMSRTMKGRINFWNRRAEEFYGWRKDEAVGKVSHNLLRTQFPIPLEEIESVLVRDGRWVGKLVHTTRDGGRVVVKSRWALHLKGQFRSVVEINTGPVDF